MADTPMTPEREAEIRERYRLGPMPPAPAQSTDPAYPAAVEWQGRMRRMGAPVTLEAALKHVKETTNAK